ncbi:uncharacterized protein BDW70DRAFT_145987 [Aspergillus foveolatus]|uniref:uncharacterized protein n=1 Tax=Aspergillus foveolatus TaxID=210207 RepID=UPI003CCE50F3
MMCCVCVLYASSSGIWLLASLPAAWTIFQIALHLILAHSSPSSARRSPSNTSVRVPPSLTISFSPWRHLASSRP